MSALSDDSELRGQFQLLEQQQQKKLQQRKQVLTAAKTKRAGDGEKSTDNGSRNESAATLSSDNDDLNLQVADDPIGLSTAADPMQRLSDQNRELKDETGRLYKLLSERDFELKQQRKKREEERALSAAMAATTGGGSAGTSDAAASKIVELSKKVRELTAELEAERARTKQLAKRFQETENMSQTSSVASGGVTVRKSVSINPEPDTRTSLADELRITQDRLRATEVKTAEFRVQTQSLRAELKLTQKVLAQEVGEGVQVQSLVTAAAGTAGSGGATTPGTGWRGRAQQITALQKKITELKKQLENQQPTQPGSRGDLSALEEEMLYGSVEGGEGVGEASPSRWGGSRGGGGMGGKGVDEKSREQIKKIEKQRKENAERTATELKALEQEHEELKQKTEASKARSKVLSGENKTLKQQVQTLIDKGRHDDELISALFKQLAQLKQCVEETTKGGKKTAVGLGNEMKHVSVRDQQESNLIEQLRVIIADKEDRTRQLEAELNALKNAHRERSAVHFQDGGNDSYNNNGRHSSSSIPSCSRSSSNLSVDGERISEIVDGLLSPSQGDAPGGLAGVGRAAEYSYRSGRSSSHSQNRGELDRTPGMEVPETRWRQQTPFSHTRHDGTVLNGTNSLEYHELNTLYQATTVERDRFAELVLVLEKRNEEATMKQTAVIADLQAQRRQNALLEKQLGKVKAELAQQTSMLSTAASGGKNKNKKNDDVINSAAVSGQPVLGVDELQLRLDIQMDENEALRAALHRTLRAKDEDIKSYTEMMEETKRVFLQGIRQCRDSGGNMGS